MSAYVYHMLQLAESVVRLWFVSTYTRRPCCMVSSGLVQLQPRHFSRVTLNMLLQLEVSPNMLRKHVVVDLTDCIIIDTVYDQNHCCNGTLIHTGYIT